MWLHGGSWIIAKQHVFNVKSHRKVANSDLEQAQK